MTWRADDVAQVRELSEDDLRAFRRNVLLDECVEDRHTNACQGVVPYEVLSRGGFPQGLENFCAEAVDLQQIWIPLETVPSTYYPNATLGCCEVIVACTLRLSFRQETFNLLFNGLSALALLSTTLHSTWLLMSLPAIGVNKSRMDEGSLLVDHFRFHFTVLQGEFFVGLLLAFFGITTVCSIKSRYKSQSSVVSYIGPLSFALESIILLTVVSTIARSRQSIGDYRHVATGIGERQRSLEQLYHEAANAAEGSLSLKERVRAREIKDNESGNKTGIFKSGRLDFLASGMGHHSGIGHGLSRVTSGSLKRISVEQQRQRTKVSPRLQCGGVVNVNTSGRLIPPGASLPGGIGAVGHSGGVGGGDCDARQHSRDGHPPARPPPSCWCGPTHQRLVKHFEKLNDNL